MESGQETSCRKLRDEHSSLVGKRLAVEGPWLALGEPFLSFLAQTSFVGAPFQALWAVFSKEKCLLVRVLTIVCSLMSGCVGVANVMNS